jgi:Selenocysteine synthase N terminal
MPKANRRTLKYMENENSQNPAEILRMLPSVDAVLHSETAAKLLTSTGLRHLTFLIRTVTEKLRGDIQESIATLNSSDFRVKFC